MDIQLEPGRYIVAVSGGVDSVALLHVLRDLPDVELVVAHFDHGIRPDSVDDRLFVEHLADMYEMPVVYDEGRLGPTAGEATARHVRYDFLERVRREHEATAIVTAHHQDDVLETAIINLLRGTGRKGLSALDERPGLQRPLLKIPKSDLIAYARQHNLEWREDSTNQDQAYLRNYVRHRILPRFDEQSRAMFLDIIQQSRDDNHALDVLLKAQIDMRFNGDGLDRQWFTQLPHAVALEVMAAWLRAQDIRGFDSPMLERLVVAAKTAPSGHDFDVMQGVMMSVGKADLALGRAER
jgi:tRNA(Ile)-lysidine synthase